jgi:hypothetical protein
MVNYLYCFIFCNRLAHKNKIKNFTGTVCLRNYINFLEKDKFQIKKSGFLLKNRIFPTKKYCLQ